MSGKSRCREGVRGGARDVLDEPCRIPPFVEQGLYNNPKPETRIYDMKCLFKWNVSISPLISIERAKTLQRVVGWGSNRQCRRSTAVQNSPEKWPRVTLDSFKYDSILESLCFKFKSVYQGFWRLHPSSDLRYFCNFLFACLAFWMFLVRQSTFTEKNSRSRNWWPLLWPPLGKPASAGSGRSALYAGTNALGLGSYYRDRQAFR